MLEKLKEIILNNQATTLELGINRGLASTPLAGKLLFISGKSTYMLQLMQKLFAQGVSRENIIQINFFDSRLHKLHHSNLEVIVEAYYSMYPEKKYAKGILFF